MTVLRRTLLVSSVVVTTLGLAGCAGEQEGELAKRLESTPAVTSVAPAAAREPAAAQTPAPRAEPVEPRVVDIVPLSAEPLSSTSAAPELSTLTELPTPTVESAPATVTVTEAPSSGPPTDAAGNELVAPPAAPKGLAGPGQVVPINDIDGTFTAECAGGEVQISGIDNVVTITGHCSKLTVSGVDNTIVIDSFDELNLSGVRNHITYLQGEYTDEPGGIECVVVKG